MTTTARVRRLTGAALLATVLVAPGIAHADPEHRSEEAASHQPANKPSDNATPPGQDKRANPEPPGQSKAKPHPTPGATSNPGAAQRNDHAPAKPANGDPAGNNGTIKIDYPAPADSGNANRPHPGCAFQLRMFNFDDDQYGSLVIRAQAPTDGGTLLTRRILLSSDPAGGGQDVDEVYSFSAADLGLIGIPQAKQGWHTKVAVNAESAPGGAKQKVLWLSCPEATAAAPALAPRNLVQRPAVALGSAEVDLVTEDLTAVPAVTANSRVAPALLRFAAGGGGLLRGAALPFTGLGVSLLLTVAGVAMVLGVVALAAGRRRATR